MQQVPKARLSKNATNIYTPLTYDKVKKPWDRLSRFKPAEEVKTRHENRLQIIQDVWTKPLGPILAELSGGNIGPIYTWPDSVKGKPIEDWSPEDVEQFGDLGMRLAMLYHMREHYIENYQKVQWIKDQANKIQQDFGKGGKDDEEKKDRETMLKSMMGTVEETETRSFAQDLLDVVKNHLDPPDQNLTEGQARVKAERESLQDILAEASQDAYNYDKPYIQELYVETGLLGANGYQIDMELSNEIATVYYNADPSKKPIYAARGSRDPFKHPRDWGKNVLNTLGLEGYVNRMRRKAKSALPEEAAPLIDEVTRGLDTQHMGRIKQLGAIRRKYPNKKFLSTGHSQGGTNAMGSMSEFPDMFAEGHFFNPGPTPLYEGLENVHVVSTLMDPVSISYQDEHHRNPQTQDPTQKKTIRIRNTISGTSNIVAAHSIKEFTGRQNKGPVIDFPENVSPEAKASIVNKLGNRLAASGIHKVVNAGKNLGKGMVGVGIVEAVTDKIGASAEAIGTAPHNFIVGAMGDGLVNWRSPLNVGGLAAGISYVAFDATHEALKDSPEVLRALATGGAAVGAYHASKFAGEKAMSALSKFFTSNNLRYMALGLESAEGATLAAAPATEGASLLALGGEVLGAAVLTFIADNPSVQKFFADCAGMWDEYVMPLLEPIGNAFDEAGAAIAHEAHIAAIYANPMNWFNSQRRDYELQFEDNDYNSRHETWAAAAAQDP